MVSGSLFFVRQLKCVLVHDADVYAETNRMAKETFKKSIHVMCDSLSFVQVDFDIGACIWHLHVNEPKKPNRQLLSGCWISQNTGG